MNKYVPGQLVRVRAEFRVDGSLINPTVVEVHYRDALGVQVDDTAEEEDVGIWTYDIDTTDGAPGIWRWRMTGTSPAQAATEGQFTVLPTEFT